MKNYNSKCKLCELDMPHQHMDIKDLIPEWKNLTDDEIMNLYTSHYDISGNLVLKEDYEFVKKIEQALKEKNA